VEWIEDWGDWQTSERCSKGFGVRRRLLLENLPVHGFMETWCFLGTDMD
jgi:hypothetical protein